jgi:hypothetical protein
MHHYAQTELSLIRKADSASVPIETIRSKKMAGAAFTLACDCSCLDDKEIYLALGIDAGYFSNIKKGKATLQADLTAAFCRVVGNRIYPEWIAYQVGCTLVQIMSESERQCAELTEALKREQLKNKVLEDVLRGKS